MACITDRQMTSNKDTALQYSTDNNETNNGIGSSFS